MHIDSISYELTTSTDEDRKLRKACEDFAAIFFYHLFKARRRTVPREGMLGESLGEGIYRDMWTYEVAKLASKRGTELGRMLYSELRQNI